MLYIRNDVLELNVSRAHQGCGQKHVRPTGPTGAPVTTWEFTCPMCELSLRDDPRCSGSLAKLPETPDETAVREDQEARGRRETATANAAALEQIATLPQVFAQFAALLTGQQAAGVPTVGAVCASGHANPVGSVFCCMCGEKIAGRALGEIGPVVSQTADGGYRITELHAPRHDDPEIAKLLARNAAAPATGALEDKSMAELRQMATDRGLPTARSKAEQLDILRRVGV